MSDAIARVAAFLALYRMRRGLDPQHIHSLGTADEPVVLTVDDLQALLDDAGRYRWLRDVAGDEYAYIVQFNEGKDWDEAIDAVRHKE